MWLQNLSNNINVIQWETIKTIPSQPFWFVFACLSFFLVLSVYRAYKATLKLRKIEDTPISKIRSAAQGWVELEGTQHFLNGLPLIAPLSKKPCTWYHYSIYYYKKNGWQEVESAKSESPFMLKDGTGECIIDPRGAEIQSDTLDTWGGFQRHPNGKPKTWFGKLFGLFGHYRYYEYRMENDMPLHGMGYFRTTQIDDKTANILSNFTANNQQPYMLYSKSAKKIQQQARKETVKWTIFYILFFLILSFLLIIRVY